MTYRRVRQNEVAIRRRAAQLIRLLGFIGFGGGWLVLLGYIVLLLSGKADNVTPLAVLWWLASMVAYRLVRELADQIERGEWP